MQILFGLNYNELFYNSRNVETVFNIVLLDNKMYSVLFFFLC